MEEYDYSRLRHCGEDVRIAANVVIRRPELVSIGNHVAIDDFFYLTTALELGDYVHIAPFCSIIGGAEGRCVMKDFAGLSAGCRLVCRSADYLGSGLTNPTVPEPYLCDHVDGDVTLEKHAVLGTNCVVHPGVTIGEGAAVGSCSLVNRDLEPWKVYFGSPARARGDRDRQTMLAKEAELRRDLG